MAVFGWCLNVGKRAARMLAGNRGDTTTDWLKLASVLAIGIFGTAVALAQSTSTSERYFNSASDAQAACTAEPVEYYCDASGQLYQSACNAIVGPHGAGLSNVTRVEMSKPAGSGACYYSAGSSLRYTYMVWKDAGCPAGTTFTGPSVNDCANTTFTQTSQANQKGCGGGGGNGSDSTCQAQGTASADVKEPMGNPINSTIGNKTQREVDINGGNGIPGFFRTYNSPLLSG